MATVVDIKILPEQKWYQFQHMIAEDRLLASSYWLRALGFWLLDFGSTGMRGREIR